MPTDSTLTHDGVALAIRDYGGEGSPILLVHGAGRTLADFYALGPLLARQHHVVAMDLRGHGLSDDAPWTAEAVLEDIDAVISQLELTDVAIVGHSLGGMLAAQYGATHPLRAAVNLDGHGMGTPDLYLGIDPARVTEVLEQMQALHTPPTEAPVLTDEQLSGMAAGLAALGVPADDARAIARRGVDSDGHSKPYPSTAAEMGEVIGGFDLFADYERCQAPLLVYNATNPDPMIAALPIAGIGDLMAAYRRGLDQRLSSLDHLSYQQIDATHALVFEQPELICDQIEAFLG